MAKTSPASTSPRPGSESSGEQDWPAQATQAIVTQVERIRDKTTGPVLKGAHYTVFGAFAVWLGTVALVIFVIGAVRALDNYLPNSVFGETHVWAAHTILGTILLLGGLLLFRKAKATPDE